MSIPRFYIAPQHWQEDALVLDEDESHHCLEVLRLQEGNQIRAFNGQGVEVLAEISHARKRSVSLKTISVSTSAPPPARISLGQAVPKGKNMELIIEKATELGASEIFPLLTDRTVVRLDGEEAKRKQEKWQRVAIEACKQCGQNWLPQVRLPMNVDRFLASQPTAELLLIAAIEDGARRLKEFLPDHTARPSSAMVLVGPEGDFTPAELAAAKTYGFLPLTLGPIILRAETAAIFSLSVLAHELF